MGPVPRGSLATSATALKTRLMWKIVPGGAKWANLPSWLSFPWEFQSLL